MEQIENHTLPIIRLYLEKVELLTQREREALIKSIEILNHPMFITLP